MMTREEFETKFAVLCLGGDFKKHKELKALVRDYIGDMGQQALTTPMSREDYDRSLRKVLTTALPWSTEAYSAMCNVIYYINQLESQIPHWRSVEKDGLPEHENKVLVVTRRGDYEFWSWERDDEQWSDWNVGHPKTCVTHYLPLSDLPEPIEEA